MFSGSNDSSFVNFKLNVTKVCSLLLESFEGLGCLGLSPGDIASAGSIF
jgi:hypothetical protein